MLIDSKVYSLQVQRLPDGGFMVLDGYRPNDYCGPRMAASSIEEALKYCKRKLDTEHNDGK